MPVETRVSGRSVNEFIYLDTDTGEMMCMVLDYDGFRPASINEQFQSVDLQIIYDAMDKHSDPVIPAGRERKATAIDEFNGISAFIHGREQSYGSPAPRMC